MLADIKKQTKTYVPNVLAVETAVVDLQYPKNTDTDELKHRFFSHLREMIIQNGGSPLFQDNPRGGDMCMILAEDFDSALIRFAQENALMPDTIPDNTNDEDTARIIRESLFGTPKITAGGSLANTFHALVNVRADKTRLVTGHFATAIGTEKSADVFYESLRENIHHKQRGRQMECHVFPIDHDRILITTPGRDNPAESYINGDLLKHAGLNGRDRIMLGGFLFFTPGFESVYNTLIKHLKNTPLAQRPDIVMTAAAQSVATNKGFRSKIRSVSNLANTTIHANTGEFRRLLNMDRDWRVPYEKDFMNLRGHALESAKDQNTAYKAAKDRANTRAFSYAIQSARTLLNKRDVNLRYVITDGSRGIYIITADGLETYRPHKVEKSAIVSTVGAGDNFAAGFQLGDLYNLSHPVSVMLGRDFARAIIQSHDARLNPEDSMAVLHAGQRWHLSGGLSKIDVETLLAIVPPAWPKPTPPAI